MRDVAQLLSAVDELIHLLRCCGEDERAAWLAERRAVIRRSPQFPAAEAACREVRNGLAGMGSLSDLWLESGPGCELTNREVERRQRELAERLDRLTADSSELERPPRMIPTGSSSEDPQPR